MKRIMIMAAAATMLATGAQAHPIEFFDSAGHWYHQIGIYLYSGGQTVGYYVGDFLYTTDGSRCLGEWSGDTFIPVIYPLSRAKPQ
jgi:hypothetical protein